jgi:hypothetical protein
LLYVMMAKEKMREERLKSPDLIVVTSFAFLEGCYYLRQTGRSQRRLTGGPSACPRQREGRRRACRGVGRLNRKGVPNASCSRLVIDRRRRGPSLGTINVDGHPLFQRQRSD